MGKLRKIFMFLTVSAALVAIAHDMHKGHHPVAVTKEEKTAFEIINERYLSEIKPIFEKKCFDCHSSKTQFPWYQKVPSIKQWIQHDIDEAREHLDFEPDFPFKSHASPAEDLEAIENEVVKSNDMPPFSYRIMHSGMQLSLEEKETVRKWIQFANEVLKEKTIDMKEKETK